MQQPARIIGAYHALEGASQEMLQAARAGDWDSVRRLEGVCAQLIARLELRKQAAPPLAAHEQPERLRLRLLRSLLAKDVQIRRIAQPLPACIDPLPA